MAYFDEQEFVKLILIGSATEEGVPGNGIRSLVWNVLRTKPTNWLKDIIEGDLSIDDFASIVNGIHGPNSPRGDMELQKEIMLLPLEDVTAFSNVLITENNRSIARAV